MFSTLEVDSMAMCAWSAVALGLSTTAVDTTIFHRFLRQDRRLWLVDWPRIPYYVPFRRLEATNNAVEPLLSQDHGSARSMKTNQMVKDSWDRPVKGCG